MTRCLQAGYLEFAWSSNEIRQLPCKPPVGPCCSVKKYTGHKLACDTQTLNQYVFPADTNDQEHQRLRDALITSLANTYTLAAKLCKMSETLGLNTVTHSPLCD